MSCVINPESKISENAWIAPALIVIGISLRLLAAIPLASIPLVGDTSAYHEFAIQIRSGTEIDYWWPPGLSLYLIPFHVIFGTGRLVSILAMIPWYLLASIFLYRLTVRIGNRKAGQVALALFAFWPTLVFLSIIPSTHFPLAALLLVAVDLLFTIKDSSTAKTRHLVLLGLCLGAATLVRPSTFLLAITVPLMSPLLGKKSKPLLIAPIVALLVLAPWLIEARRSMGYWIPVNQHNARNLFLGNNQWTPLYKTWFFGSHFSDEKGVPSELSELEQEIQAYPQEERNAVYMKKVVDHILARPDLFLLRSFNRARCFFAFDTLTGTILIKEVGIPLAGGLGIIAIDAAFYFPVMLFAIPSLLFLGAKVDKRIAQIILAVVLGYTLPYWIAFSHPTYHLPVLPLFLILASVLVGFLLSGNWSIRGDLIPRMKSRAVILIYSIFLYIQLEWIFVMFSRIQPLP